MHASQALARFRTETDAHLFPEDPTPPGLHARATIVYLVLTALAAGVQLLRMWDSRPLDSMWAEDGAVWLSDALNRDFFDAFTASYNGYLQGLSRLVAEPVSWLPVDWYAPAMAIVGAVIASGCAFFVWRASCAQIRNPYLRAFLAAMVLLLPVVGAESLANLTNSIWPLLFASFWALLWRPASFAAAVGAAILVLVAGLTNIGVIFLIPVWLLRLIAVRDRRDLVIVAAFAIGLAMQLGLSATDIGLRGQVGDEVRTSARPACSVYSTEPCWDWELVPAYVQRIVGGAVAGQQINGELWKAIGSPLLVVLGCGLVALIAVALRERRTRILVPLTIAISIATFLVAGWQRWGAGGLFFYWQEGEFTVGSHYLITPTLLLLTAIILQLDAAIGNHPGESVGRFRRETLTAVAVIFILASAAVGFHVGDQGIRGSGSWADEVSEAKTVCNQQDPPSAAQVSSGSAFGFAFSLPCDRLR